MHISRNLSLASVPRDFAAGLVVFLVALPLCLGVALASGAPLLAGVLAGIVGGILVGMISQSQTSVSGPAAGLTTIVAASIHSLGFQAFLTAVVIAGLIQSALGIVRAGFVARFVPSSVIKGLLAAIGMLLILKQLPHVVGYQANLLGDTAFHHTNQANSLTAVSHTLRHVHLGAALIGVVSTAFLLTWGHCKALKQLPVPAPLAVVALGVGLGVAFRQIGGPWSVASNGFVNVPVAQDWATFIGYLQWPDFTQWRNPAVYTTGLTIAVVASLETLLNLEAVDKIDPRQRTSPPSLELLAQGVGNVVVGLVGGIPITSVIVRSSVNINAGGQTRLATIIHGVLLLVSVALFPKWLNLIPLSCLAAILFVTGVKLVSPTLVQQMWTAGRHQFAPFVCTLAGILLTDLLVGILIGLAASVGFILNSNFRRPVRRILERHLGGDILRIELANQVSFLNRAALFRALDAVPNGGHVLLDAQNTDYIDPDILDLLHDFTTVTAPARHISVSLTGFKSKYRLQDQVQYVDYSTRDVQSQLGPRDVLQVLTEGNRRFRTGERLTRDLGRQVQATADSQHPLAVVVSCIDSRAPVELIFDVGIGDIFSIRIAGNVITSDVLGSVEYACGFAGAKLVLVMGHTRCGAVATAVELASGASRADLMACCQHLEPVLEAIQRSIPSKNRGQRLSLTEAERQELCDAATRGNVTRMVELLTLQSESLRCRYNKGQLAVVGAIYNVATGEVQFLPSPPAEVEPRISLCA